MQTITSANTSINSCKLPAISRKINWEQFRNGFIIDYGGGKYDNFKQFLKENYNIDLLIYDPYNRTKEENREALVYLNPDAYSRYPDAIICSNVLNVIREDKVVENIVRMFLNIMPFCPVFITVYEGNKTGVGKISKKDCYQRNCSIESFKNRIDSLAWCSISAKNKVICCSRDLEFVR